MRATMVWWALLIGFVISCASASSALAAPEHNVYVGVYVHDLTEFDVKHGTFQVDAQVWARWRGDFDPNDLRLANAGRIERELLNDEHDGDWHVMRWRIRGTMRGEFEVDRFPFDVQRPAIVVELDERHGTLSADMASSGMSSHFSLSDWYYSPRLHTVSSAHEYRSDMGSLGREAQTTRVDRVRFEMELERPTAPIATKMFLPVGIILLIVFVSLFVPISGFHTRCSIAVTALLSCFAFQFTVSRSLPAVTYLTLADQLFLIGYLMSALALLETVIAHRLDQAEEPERVRRLEVGMKIAAPALCIGLVVVAVPGPPPATVVRPEPAPRLERHASSKDTLRIGTTLLRSSSAPLVSLLWGTGIEQENCAPLYLEHRAGVDTPALELLAGGKMAVTWTLRKHATWSDGSPLTSADVALSLNTAAHDALADVEVLDARRVRVTYDARLFEALGCPGALHPSAASLVADGGIKAWATHRKKNAVPTIGPYVIEEYVPGERLVARANPNFIGAAPAIPNVEITRYTDREALLADYLAGSLDLVYPNSLTPEQMEQARASKPDHVYMKPGPYFIHMTPDLGVPALDDIELRRALLAAIDRERILETIYPDGGRIAHAPLARAEHVRGLREYAHDPEAARALFEAKGFTSVKLVRSGSPVDARVAELISEDLSALGVTVTQEQVKSTYQSERKGGWGGLLLRVRRGSAKTPPEAFFNLPYDGRYDTSTRHSGFDDAVAETIRQREGVLFPERRAQLRERIEIAYSELLPTLPLVFGNERILADPRLRDWHEGPDRSFMMRLDRWWFERDEDAPPE